MMDITDDEPCDLQGIAQLLGVSKNTPNQWRQRSRNGGMSPPLPEPDIPNLAHPLWYKRTIIEWAQECTPPRWPPGVSGRPHMRGPRKGASMADQTPNVPPAVFIAPD